MKTDGYFEGLVFCMYEELSDMTAFARQLMRDANEYYEIDKELHDALTLLQEYEDYIERENEKAEALEDGTTAGYIV